MQCSTKSNASSTHMLCIIVEKITPIQLEIPVLPTLHKVAVLIEVSFFLKKKKIHSLH